MTVQWRRAAFPVLLVAAVLVLASTLSAVLAPVLVAILLAVLMHPVVDRASRFHLPRSVSVSVLYVLLVVVALGGVASVGGEFKALSQELRGEEFFGDLDGDGLIGVAQAAGERDEFHDINGNGLWDGGALMALTVLVDRERQRLPGGPVGQALYETGGALLDLFGEMAGPATGMVASGIEQLADWAGGLMPLITLIVLIPFYLFFFLVEYPQMSTNLRRLVPPRHRDTTERVARDIGKELVAFLRGRLACGMIKALMLWVGMMLLGIPYALPISLVTGLLSLVPFLGFLAGLLPASVLALTMTGGGTQTLIYVVVLFGAAEAFEGAVLFPIVLGKETGLHPVLLVVVLLAGGSLMGTVGVLASIPVALVIKVLWREVGVPLYLAWAFPEPGRELAGED
jgi:predicted PurR-regulated permease PerM